MHKMASPLFFQSSLATTRHAPPLQIATTMMILLMLFSQQLFHSQHHSAVVLGLSISSTAPQTYRYFAIGSNMVPATMTSLRNIHPLALPTAAILPDYELAFDIAGNPLIEPSAASVRRRTSSDSTASSDLARVHGVLYELSETDFGRLGASEGVPFVYQWETCRVFPYVGDSECAGMQKLQRVNEQEESDDAGVEAYVLMASRFVAKNRRRTADIPPSQSYLQILQDGAAYWKMDRDYQEKLAAVPVNRLTPGISNLLLQAAKRFNPK